MPRTHSATLPDLPVEIIHRIFDGLEGTAVLLLVRNVCQRLRATVDTYHRFELDLTSISKRRFHQVIARIHPQHVTALTLNDVDDTPGQIGLLLSLIDIGLFTQLRSLSLKRINGPQLCLFLEHARRCSLTSLTIESLSLELSDRERIGKHLSSIIVQSTFLRLRLQSDGNCNLIDELTWPAECKLRYLKLLFVTKVQMRDILLHAPDLQTFDLGIPMGSMFQHWKDATEIFLAPHSRLTSLFVADFDPIQTILSCLCFTPALRHLKIISTNFHWPEECQLEELIKTNLPVLEKLEFYSSFCRNPSESGGEGKLDQLISPFCTSFWTEEKRWMVQCNWFLTLHVVELYTVPICASRYLHRNDSNTKIASNFSDELEQSVISKDVHQLHMAPSRSELELVERRGEGLIHQWFPNVNDLLVLFEASYPRYTFPSVLDLKKLTKLTLELAMSTAFTPLELNCIIDLLEQASSIHSLSVYGESFNASQSSKIEQMNSIIIRHVNGSKLRQLQVPVCNVNQVQMLLNRFRNLCSIQLVSYTESLPCDKLIAFVKASMPGCSTLSDSGVASIWLGERKDATSYSTTLASGFRSVRQSVKSLFQ